MPADLQDYFVHYVMNKIPIRLIHIETMSIVDRSLVRRHLQSHIDAIKEQDLDQSGRELSLILRRVARYAILSHRWVDGEEPLFGDLEDKESLFSSTSRGFIKLRAFCVKVESFGFEFAWSDTCCIDKRSSAELDESLRSVFRWYRNSSVCFVHLAQTSQIDDVPSDEWLERSWTLQEYIAPKTIKFFDKDWELLTDLENDKADTSPVKLLIQEATGINVEQDFAPGPYYVDERMAWAANRKTTRAEDMAYSLMGIFKVSIQVAYGEGKEQAFIRLMEAVMRAGDPSVLNWAGESADHPSSDAIPPSPASYANHPP
ncbi:hypothetical protein ID866_368 [Astraeus odoratus]|nr:hypothetical protein ID866_368 [Astraeus odoratus]